MFLMSAASARETLEFATRVCVRVFRASDTAKQTCARSCHLGFSRRRDVDTVSMSHYHDGARAQCPEDRVSSSRLSYFRGIGRGLTWPWSICGGLRALRIRLVAGPGLFVFSCAFSCAFCPLGAREGWPCHAALAGATDGRLSMPEGLFKGARRETTPRREELQTRGLEGQVAKTKTGGRRPNNRTTFQGHPYFSTRAVVLIWRVLFWH